MRRPFQVLMVAAASAAIAACGMNRSEKGGPETTRAFPVGDFSSIEVAGPYDVHVRTGGKPGVSVKGPEKILDRMVVEVDGGELQIRSKKTGLFGNKSWGGHSSVVVEVTAPSLEGAAIAGSGDMTVDKVKGAEFKGAIAGSGSLSVGAIEVEKLKLSIAGSGDINAAGKAAEAKYSIAGSGSVKVPKLDSQALKVSIAGSGDVAAHSAGTADIDLMGSGNVTVTGGAKCTVSKMGSGSANCS
jgi:hypothetical protein